MPGDRLGDTTKEEPAQAAAPVTSGDNQIGGLRFRGLEYRAHGLALKDVGIGVGVSRFDAALRALQEVAARPVQFGNCRRHVVCERRCSFAQARGVDDVTKYEPRPGCLGKAESDRDGRIRRLGIIDRDNGAVEGLCCILCAGVAAHD